MKINEKCDVYSFGVVALEILMRKTPNGTPHFIIIIFFSKRDVA
jgi:hypothetical protein